MTLKNITAKKLILCSIMRSWIESNKTYCIVAEKADGAIVGFACISGAEVMLNYVTPEALYKGVGKEMLRKLELHAYSTGIHELQVVSSLSAKAFYERNGYVPNGSPAYVGHILGDFPLIKSVNS